MIYGRLAAEKERRVGEKGERRKLVRNGEGKMAGFGQHFCRV